MSDRGYRPRWRAAAQTPLTLLVLILALPGLAPAETVREHYEDGSLLRQFSLDRDGLKHGSFKELWPNGEKRVTGKYRRGERTGKWTTYYDSGNVQEVASYRDGKLDGKLVRKLADGKPWLTAVYDEGELASPMTVRDPVSGETRHISYPRSLAAVREQIAELDLPEAPAATFAVAPSVTAPFVAGRLSAESLDPAIGVLRLIRYLCGASDGQVLVADPGLCEDAQHVAVLLQLTGTNASGIVPRQPGGMDDAFYNRAQRVARDHHPCWGDSPLACVLSVILAGDMAVPTLIEGRCRLLCPQNQSVGFGFYEGTGAFHYITLDGPRKCGRAFVALPAEGYYPVELMPPSGCWSVAFEEHPPRPSDELRVAVHRMNEDYSLGEQIAVQGVRLHETVDTAPNLGFFPNLPPATTGRFWVEITGLNGKRYPGGTLGYLVELTETDLPDWHRMHSFR